MQIKSAKKKVQSLRIIIVGCGKVLIRAGDGNHQIGLLKPGFLQHAEARAVALNPHHVEHIRRQSG